LFCVEQYSGLAEGRPKAMLLRMVTGAIDRGVCIRELSQYPGEVEYLWVPCSFLESAGAPSLELVEDERGGAGGVVSVVPVRVNANLKAQTVDELRGQKKAMHLAAFRYMLGESARDLERIAREEGAQERLMRDRMASSSMTRFLVAGGKREDLLEGMTDGEIVRFSVEGLLFKIGRECEVVLARHAAVPAERYTADEAYRGLVSEMLETKAAAKSTLRHWLENPVYTIETVMRASSLLDGHRLYVAYLERTLPAAKEERAVAAARLCRTLGLMESMADETDAEDFTRLMSAAADGAGVRALRCLVAAGAEIDRIDATKGRAALYIAANYGQADAVEALARLGADVNKIARAGVFDTTPMCIAANEGHAEVLEVLCRLGADINRPARDGRTPIYMAACAGHVAAVETLGLLGADVNRPNEDGRTPVYIAAEQGHLAAVEALARLGADVKRACAKGLTPLSVAAHGQHTAVVEALRRLEMVELRSGEGARPSLPHSLSSSRGKKRKEDDKEDENL
jgi:hypothetical protein